MRNELFDMLRAFKFQAPDREPTAFCITPEAERRMLERTFEPDNTFAFSEATREKIATEGLRAVVDTIFGIPIRWDAERLEVV